MKKGEDFSVAICLATYNGEMFLSSQLDSLFRQTYTDFHLYICDDASTDKTMEILTGYQKKYPKRVKLTQNTKNVGYVKNFETLIASCKEDYVALCDQDDIWVTHKLEDELKVMLTQNTDEPVLVHTDLEMVDSQLDVLQKSYFDYRGIVLDENKAFNKIIGHNGVMGCTVLMNRALINKALPFPSGLDVHDYWLALVNEVCGKRITLHTPLVRYRIHNSNASNTRGSLLKGRAFMYTVWNKDRLPFRGTGREYVLRTLLQNFELSAHDRGVVHTFIDYLENRKNRFLILYGCIKYKLFRDDLRYKTKIYLKILFG